MSEQLLIHSDEAYCTACDIRDTPYEITIDDNLNFVEKLKIIDTDIRLKISLGKFQAIINMKQDPFVTHELLNRGYDFIKYTPELTIITWKGIGI